MKECLLHKPNEECNHERRNTRVILVNRLLSKMIKQRSKDNLREGADLGYNHSYSKAEKSAHVAIEGFYQEVLQNWANSNEKLVLNFLSRKYLMIYSRQMSALALKIVALTLITFGGIYFKTYNPLLMLASIFVGLIMLLLAMIYKSFNKDLIRHSGSRSYPNDCYWTMVTTKENFQKKNFLELDAMCFSHDYFIATIPLYVKKKDALDTAIILHKDGFHATTKELIEAANLL
jgi:hypothetical protein